MIPHVTPKNAGENAQSQKGAAHFTADEHAEGPIDPDLQDVVQRWPNLPEAVRTGILAMVRQCAADDNSSG